MGPNKADLLDPSCPNHLGAVCYRGLHPGGAIEAFVSSSAEFKPHQAACTSPLVPSALLIIWSQLEARLPSSGLRARHNEKISWEASLLGHQGLNMNAPVRLSHDDPASPVVSVNA